MDYETLIFVLVAMIFFGALIYMGLYFSHEADKVRIMSNCTHFIKKINGDIECY